jgi:hypothetical protein
MASGDPLDAVLNGTTAKLPSHASPESKPLSPEQNLINTCIGSFCDSKRYEDLLSGSSDPASISSRDINTLFHCGNPILKLLLRVSNIITSRHGDYGLAMKRLDDLIALANEKFYAYPFKDVPACWRELFREASLLKVSALTVKDIWGESKESEREPAEAPSLDGDRIDEMVKTIDMALIMAGPPISNVMRERVNDVLDLLQEIHMRSIQNDEGQPVSKRRKLDIVSSSGKDHFPSSSPFMPPVSNPITKVTEPSFERFQEHMSRPANIDLGPEPIIIKGALDHWPARSERPWSSPDYLMSKTIGGRRLVPIETGRSYVDEGWGQRIITFKEFMDQYILPSPTSPGLATGYLAQHDLFAQIPPLRNDITVPDYCYTSPPPPHYSSPLAAKHTQTLPLEEPLLNAWFGPAGTISPLHTDPYHNILAQVVGRKYIRLYSPRESEKVYARGVEDGGVDMGNTSAADIGVLAGWDGTGNEQMEAHEKFPLWRDAEYVDCVLEEGECLYIPVGWWHYVRSLSVSFSVSFWFN